MYLSRGLVASLTEDELRAVLRWSALRCARSGLGLESLCGAAAIRLFRGVPSSWRAIALEGGLPIPGDAPGRHVPELNPLSALRFLVVYPWADLFFRCSHLARMLGSSPVEELLPDPSGIMGLWAEDWIGAMRKASRAAEVWRTAIVPAPRA